MPDQFKIGYCNMHSVENQRKQKNKIEKMQHYIVNNSLDMFAITETWFVKDRDYTERAPEGYRLFPKPRVGRGGGGVALIVKNDLTVEDAEEEHGPEIANRK